MNGDINNIVISMIIVVVEDVLFINHNHSLPSSKIDL